MSQRRDSSVVASELEQLFKEDTEKQGPLPKKWGVTYVGSNPDGSRKNCKNCIFWVNSRRCVLHDPELNVSGDAVCGYHVHGTTRKEWSDLPGIMRLLPAESGLEKVDGGTSCSNCHFFESKSETTGTCDGLTDDSGKHPDVESLGCCSRWEKAK